MRLLPLSVVKPDAGKNKTFSDTHARDRNRLISGRVEYKFPCSWRVRFAFLIVVTCSMTAGCKMFDIPENYVQPPVKGSD